MCLSCVMHEGAAVDDTLVGIIDGVEVQRVRVEDLAFHFDGLLAEEIRGIYGLRPFFLVILLVEHFGCG